MASSFIAASLVSQPDQPMGVQGVRRSLDSIQSQTCITMIYSAYRRSKIVKSSMNASW